MKVNLMVVMSQLGECTEPENYTEKYLDDILAQYPSEEDRAIRKKAFYNLVKVMKAECSEDVKDLSIEDILDCFESQSLYASFFEGAKAPHFSENFEKAWPGCERLEKEEFYKKGGSMLWKN